MKIQCKVACIVFQMCKNLGKRDLYEYQLFSVFFFQKYMVNQGALCVSFFELDRSVFKINEVHT